jgi:hypothetical protein
LKTFNKATSVCEGISEAVVGGYVESGAAGSIHRCDAGSSCRRGLHHREQGVSVSLHLPTEGAIRQCGGPGCGSRRAGGRGSQRNCASIELPHKPGDKVTVVMDLDKSTHEIIKQDSVASIETEGVLGNQFVAISFGSAGQAEVKEWRDHPEQPPLLMADLLKKTSGILDSSQQGHPEHNPGNGASELGKRQDRFGAGNRGSAGERQAAL